MSRPVVHFEIGCRDRQKADAFYSALFGWKTSDYGPFSRSIDTGSARGIPGFITALGHEPQHYVMVYVEVDDIQALLLKVAELGGSIHVPENEIPGVGSFAWIRDLDDNLVGLWKPAGQTPEFNSGSRQTR
jgi:predicted enzyme related to lactoylglutathione lyase